MENACPPEASTSTRTDDSSAVPRSSASSIDEGITHSRAVPTALPPTECVTLQELAEADGGLGEVWEEFSAIEIRVSPLDSHSPTAHSAAPPRNIWMRSAQRLSDDPLIHVAALAYASDLMLMATALTPHGYHIGQEHSLDTDWTGVSLDHTMWFSTPCAGGRVAALRALDPHSSHRQSSSECRGLRSVRTPDLPDHSGKRYSLPAPSDSRLFLQTIRYGLAVPQGARPMISGWYE